MRAAGILLAYLIGVLLCAALLAPWIFQLGQWAAAEIPALKSLGTQPFHRYLNRCLLLTALAGLWPLAREFGLTNLRAWGLAWTPESRRRLGLGWVAGFGSLLLVAVVLGLAGVRQAHLSHSLDQWLKLIVGATLSAGVVAGLEELFFRGFLFGVLRRTLALPAAVVVSSVVYAALHFLARVEHAGPVDWVAGLALLPKMFAGVVAPENLAPAGLTLTVAGAALALAYQRTGNLWFAIGLHAGWVFWLKVLKTLTTPGAQPANAFWGTDKLLDGWLALLVMAVVLVGVARLRPIPAPESPRDAIEPG